MYCVTIVVFNVGKSYAVAEMEVTSVCTLLSAAKNALLYAPVAGVFVETVPIVPTLREPSSKDGLKCRRTSVVN